MPFNNVSEFENFNEGELQKM